MNEAINNVVVGSISGRLYSGAALVPGQVGKSLYLQDGGSYLDLGFHDSRCFYDPDLCTDGVTFAMWIKSGHGTGFLLDTGSHDFAGKGNLLLLLGVQMGLLIARIIF